jgi:hypothetical protein
MPAAMPQTKIAFCWSGGSGESRAIHDVNQAAICTIGPSRPIDAPVPTDSKADALRASVVRSFRTTFPRRAASM